MVEPHLTVTTTQTAFLANKKNKIRLISSSREHLHTKNMRSAQAEADADVTIVEFALRLSVEKAIIVVGADADLLVLLTARSSNDARIWYHRPHKPDYFNIVKQRLKLREMCDLLLFAYAFTGCDMTSAIFRKGKIEAFKMLSNRADLKDSAKIFYDTNASKNAIAAAGEIFFFALYKNSSSKSLDELRYFKILPKSC